MSVYIYMYVYIYTYIDTHIWYSSVKEHAIKTIRMRYITITTLENNWALSGKFAIT